MMSDHRAQPIDRLVGDLGRAEGPEVAGRIAYDLLQQLFRSDQVMVLIPLLESDAEPIQDAAAWVASELGVRARPLLGTLVSVLRSGSRKSRFWAIDAINAASGAADGTAIAAAVALIDDEDTVISEKAADLLSRATNEQINALLASDSTGPARDAIDTLQRLLDDGTIDALRATISSEAPARRFGAAAAAVRIGTRESLEVLLDANDPSLVAIGQRELSMPKWDDG